MIGALLGADNGQVGRKFVLASALCDPINLIAAELHGNNVTF
jgi:hypothetical protein